MPLENPMSVAEPVLSVDHAMQAFLASVAGKSPATRATYASAMRRLEEFLDWAGYPPASTSTSALPGDALERFYTWLVGVYGRERRPTITTYVAGARSFFRFLMRHRQGPAETSFEE